MAKDLKLAVLWIVAILVMANLALTVGRDLGQLGDAFNTRDTAISRTAAAIDRWMKE